MVKNSCVVSVVLGSYNRLEFLKFCIESIRHELSKIAGRYEIIVVDGGSGDGSVEWLLEQKDIITIVQHNRGFWNGEKVERRSWGYFMNLAFKMVRGKYVLMISDDCLVVPGAIVDGISYFEEKMKEGIKIGAVPFYYIENFPEEKNYFVSSWSEETTYVNHGLFLRKALVEVGYVDEEKYFFYAADVDLSFKLYRAGYTIMPSIKSKILHFGHIKKRVQADCLRDDKDNKTLTSKWSSVFSLYSKNTRIYSPQIIYEKSDLYTKVFGLQWLIIRQEINIKFQKIEFAFDKILHIIFDKSYFGVGYYLRMIKRVMKAWSCF